MGPSRRRPRRYLDSYGFSDIAARCLSAARPVRTPVSDPFVATLGLPTTDIGIGYPEARTPAPDQNIRIEDSRRGPRAIATLLRWFAEG